MSQGSENQQLSEHIVQRFSQEVNRTELSICELARQIGEPHPQRIRDVMRGKQRLPADLLARAATVGIDTLYVITGQRNQAPVKPREQEFLDNYRAVSKAEKTPC